MPVINTNVNAIIARNSGAVNDRSMTKAMQSLSTGKRINVAADDAAGLAIATKMTSQIRGLNQAVRNANDGIGMLQVVEGATVEMTNMLQRMRELAVQASNDTNTSAERSYLNDEFGKLLSEIDRIAQTTQWNGQDVMDGSSAIGTANSSSAVRGSDVSFQVGANADANQKITFNIGNYSTSAAANTAAVATIAGISFQGADLDLADGTPINTVNVAGKQISLAGYSTSTTASKAGAIASGAGTFAEWQAIASAMNTALQADAAYDQYTVTATAVGALQISNADGNGAPSVVWGFDEDGANNDLATTGAEADVSIVNLSTQPTVEVFTAGNAASVASGGVFSTANFNLSNAAGNGVVNILTKADADAAIQSVDRGLTSLSNERASMGATINRLTYAADSLTNTSANVTAARSRVLDTDYAAATTELARTQIIQQASTAMLAQANQGAQSVLSLLK